MNLFDNSNMIKCGRCGCEYDANKNSSCPQCNFGAYKFNSKTSKFINRYMFT